MSDEIKCLHGNTPAECSICARVAAKAAEEWWLIAAQVVVPRQRVMLTSNYVSQQHPMLWKPSFTADLLRKIGSRNIEDVTVAILWAMQVPAHTVEAAMQYEQMVFGANTPPKKEGS